MNIRNANKCLLLTAVLLLGNISVSAHDDPPANVNKHDLAKQSQNPISTLISVPFENNSNFGVGPSDNYQNILNIKPVVPGGISKNWNLVNRAIIPVIAQDNLTSTNTGLLTDESQFGFADITYQGFFTPKKAGNIIWGIGPQFTLPTGKDAFTSDKWSAGPALVLLTMPGHWVIGTLLAQEWDFAGKGGAADVSSFTWQYFINYNFSGGWFLTSTPTMTANWKAERDSDKWTIPVGGGGGRIMKLGNQHVKLSAQAFAYAASPDAVDTDWTAQFQFVFLFPKGK